MGALAGAAVGAAGSIIGSSNAASASKAAADKAAQTQMMLYIASANKLKPFMKGGQDIFSQLQEQLPELTADFAPTMEQLEQTPGYQFTLREGLKSAQNSYAAQGLGQSGAAMKGAEQYATGLASQTYQQQFQNYMAQNQQAYNMLLGGSQIGLSAANATAGVGTQTGAGIASSIMTGGQTQAAANMSMGNAASNFGNAIGGQAIATNNWNNFGLGGQGGSGIYSNPAVAGSLY